LSGTAGNNVSETREVREVRKERVHAREQGWEDTTHLITEGMSPNDDGLDPAGDGLGDAAEDDGLAEDGPAEDVTDLV
jgi:hypothetical protein